jgi:predicted transcriptional regulator
MPISKPMQVFAFRLTDEEKANLERIAAERRVTLSYAIREGLKLYARERSESSVGEHVATT